MCPTYISDLRHFLDGDGDLVHFPGRPLAMHLCRIVEAVTSEPARYGLETGVRCRRRPGRKPCPGTIRAAHDEATGAIQWGCPSCGDNGRIYRWEGTQWDHREAESPSARPGHGLRLLGADVPDRVPELEAPVRLPDRMVNRSAVVVTPREPYVHWATHVDDEAVRFEDAVRANVSVYLVPQDHRGREEAAPIEEWYGHIFELELAGWCLDEHIWPERRDRRTFQEWFHVVAQSVVIDLGHGPLESDGL